MMKPKIGIIGTGSTVSIRASLALALAQMQDVELTGVYNRSRERSEAFIVEHDLKNTIAYASYEKHLGCCRW